MLLANSELTSTEDDGIRPGVWTAKQQFPRRISWDIRYFGESTMVEGLQGLCGFLSNDGTKLESL